MSLNLYEKAVCVLSIDDNPPFEDEVTNRSKYNQRNYQRDNIRGKLICIHCDFPQKLLRISGVTTFEIKFKSCGKICILTCSDSRKRRIPAALYCRRALRYIPPDRTSES